MKIIFRIEEKNKRNRITRGPYNSRHKNKSKFRDAMNYIHNDDEHPCRYEDFGAAMCYMSNYYFAFETINLLADWFEGCVEEAYGYGFSIAKYQVQDFKKGKSNRQVAFNKEHIIAKEYISLDEFYEMIDQT